MMGDIKRRYGGSGASTDDRVIREMLTRRGFQCDVRSPLDSVLLPEPFDEKAEKEFYEYLKKYSFRIFLRDVINHREGFREKDLVRYCSEDVVREYLAYLVRCGIAMEGGEGFRLVNQGIYSFGDTLEWFVASIFRREFHSPAAWIVRVLDSGLGGDYDVIARVESKMVFVETKSSPPKNIHNEQINAFLERVDALMPNFVFFLVDTHLRMEDKILKLFDEELEKRYKKKFGIEKLYNRIFYTRRNIFIINSKPDVVGNIRLGLRHFFGIVDQPFFK